MPKLTIVVGMGGSGKTYRCNEIAGESTPQATVFADATLTNTDERRAGHQSLGEMVARLLGQSADCVMDESHLTVPSFRDSFKQFCDTFLIGVEQQWIFFEADVVACINNAYRDAHQKSRRELDRYKALDNQRNVYEVPPNDGQWPGWTVRPVHKFENPQFTSESEAVCWLHSEIVTLSDA